MQAKTIRFLLELLLILLAVCASQFFPGLGVPNQLAQTIAFTVSVGLALLSLARKLRLPPTATMEEQSGASFAVVSCFVLALIAVERVDTEMLGYGWLFILLLLCTLIILLWERMALRRRTNP